PERYPCEPHDISPLTEGIIELVCQPNESLDVTQVPRGALSFSGLRSAHLRGTEGPSNRLPSAGAVTEQRPGLAPPVIAEPFELKPDLGGILSDFWSRGRSKICSEIRSSALSQVGRRGPRPACISAVALSHSRRRQPVPHQCQPGHHVNKASRHPHDQATQLLIFERRQAGRRRPVE